MPAFKISSGDLTNTPLLLQVAKYRKPVILSTGMSTLREVGEAVRDVYSARNKSLILLHCTSNYPAAYEDVNLRTLDTLRRRFNVNVGYSDHTRGIGVPIAAIAMGACVIEKHFTLDKDLSGPDHRASLEPDELKDMVQSVRNIEKAMGEDIKAVQKSEIEIKKVARKSIVANTDIPKGTSIIPTMVAIKRPGTGIEPKYLHRLLKKKTRVDVKKGRVLTWDLLV
jgi:N-acetylneuraminate synthase/N,N'-diacetyllegionaminate synthase